MRLSKIAKKIARKLHKPLIRLDIAKAFGHVGQAESRMLLAIEPRTTLDSVGGCENLKKWLKKNLKKWLKNKSSSR